VAQAKQKRLEADAALEQAEAALAQAQAAEQEAAAGSASAQSSREPGMFLASAPMAGYPKLYNIEMDPHEDLVVGLFGWVSDPALKAVEEYLASVKKYPNPPAPNITQFRWRGG
jgi:hypothetical protein